ncbi:hypothetical protein CSC44_5302 [Pseudomonas aeruginosa]|nr:hypothetical protein CSC44_5302 [Pseudomonas aeruginosa]
MVEQLAAAPPAIVAIAESIVGPALLCCGAFAGAPGDSRRSGGGR